MDNELITEFVTYVQDGTPLSTLAIVLVIIAALQHVAFFVLESFLWQKPAGMRVFRLSREHAAITAPLAKNQGVYNAFLAAGLFWGLKTSLGGGLAHVEHGRAIVTFFLGCAGVAGIVGAATVSRRIFWVQGVPALVALGLVLGR